MTENELQKMTDILVMAHEHDLMPMIRGGLSSLMAERRELLSAARLARAWISCDPHRPELSTEAVVKTIDQAVERAVS